MTTYYNKNKPIKSPSKSRFSGGGRGYSRGGYSGGGYSRGGFSRGPRRGWSSYELLRAIEVHNHTKEQTEHETADIKHKFEDFSITKKLKENIIAKGYINPTPIQDQGIPHMLEGRDIIGIANTGTGKTAAFLIPLIDKVYKNHKQKVIIVTPTRELAVQIDNEFRIFAAGLNVKSTLCIGGTNIFRQKKELRQNYNFVIGTPGRIIDLVKQRVLDLKTFNNVVLDETDRMVDIGFLKDIQYIISLIPEERQSLFFSATIPPKVKEILNEFIVDGVTISVKKQEAAHNVYQEVVKLDASKTKIDHLHDLLIQTDFQKVLVFGSTKHGVDKLEIELAKRGFKAGSIHGNKRQNQRQKILQDFSSSKIKILIATDVASRGLDIKNVSHVINFDIPDSYEDYIHRIGRTGRGDKKGKAITFV